MDKTVTKGAYNGYVSVLKLIASAFVVFIHVTFPGKFGSAVHALARFAVAFFFCVSGYYAYRATVPELQKRLKKITFLMILGSVIYLAWEIIYRFAITHKSVHKYIIDLLSVESVARFVFTGKIPFGSHLWYLMAMILIYLIMIAYSRFWNSPDEINYTPLYCVAICGYILMIIFAIKFRAANLKTSVVVYRYCLCFGLPAFSLGLFLRQYRERIVQNYGFSSQKAVLIIVLGSALCLLQWFGIGAMSWPVGLVPVVVVLMLAATQERQPSPQSPFKRAFFMCAETSSTVVYMIHPLIDKVISYNAKRVPAFRMVMFNKWLYPLFVLLVSLLIGMCVSIVLYAISNRKTRQNTHP